jgi:coproporphyrinogen III oxidase-like Fe-S oxidoreductase
MAYRTMENYLWLGLASSSFLDKEHSKILNVLPWQREGWKGFGLRLTNTKNLNDYLAWKRLDESATISMAHKDYLIEKFFLNLRTNQWIKDINEFKEILVPNYAKKIKNYGKEWFISAKEHVKLTDQGMDVFNTIITDLMQEI